jgi:hypothetical protein
VVVIDVFGRANGALEFLVEVFGDVSSCQEVVDRRFGLCIEISGEYLQITQRKKRGDRKRRGKISGYNRSF